MRPILVLPFAVFAALAAVLALYLAQIGSGEKSVSMVPSVLIDQPAPAIALAPLEGAGVAGFTTEDLKGQVTLVNFFASWCPPCKVEHPVLMRLAAEGVRIWGVAYKDKPEDARRFLAELGSPYGRIGIDPQGRAAIEWGVYGVPETFIVDAEGRIRHREAGPLSPKAVEEKFLAILKRVSQ